MTTSTSKAAFQDCFDYFDQALGTKLGVRIPCADPKECRHLQTRLHQARVMSRHENDEVFARNRDHPDYFTSPYDVLVIKIREKPEGTWWVYIEQRRAKKIEELEDAPPALPKPEPKPSIVEVARRRITIE